MGKTQRKTSKFLELYRKSFKKKVASVLNFTPPLTSKAAFFGLFKEVYPDDARSIEKHFQFYQEKNKNRQSGKPLYFPRPEQLLFDIAGSAIVKISETVWSSLEAEENKKAALEESELERQKRKEKYRRNNISTQEVTPPYILDLIGRYWGERQKLQRLYIAQECAKYKNSETVLFFRQVLYGENDWFIINVVFRTLQKFDEAVYLPPKGKENRNKYDTLVNMYGCEYTDDIGKGPLDIMREFYDEKHIQTLKAFDVFISHCISNANTVDDTVRYLNDVGMVAFVDWKSDKDDLKRSKTNQYTADVLKLRMRQSKCLLLIRTRESDKSIWVSWELGYFAALNKRVVILEAEDDLSEVPEFISGYPKAFLNDEKICVSENDAVYEFTDWICESKIEIPAGHQPS